MYDSTNSKDLGLTGGKLRDSARPRFVVFFIKDVSLWINSRVFQTAGGGDHRQPV